MQQKTIEALGGGPIVAAITTTLADWNVMLETATLVLGMLTGALSSYFLIRRLIVDRRRTRLERKGPQREKKDG